MEENRHFIFYAKKKTNPHGFLAYVHEDPRSLERWRGQEIHFTTDRPFLTLLGMKTKTNIQSSRPPQLCFSERSKFRTRLKYDFHEAYAGRPSSVKAIWDKMIADAKDVDRLDWAFDEKGHNCHVVSFYLMARQGFEPPHDQYSERIKVLYQAVMQQRQRPNTPILQDHSLNKI